MKPRGWDAATGGFGLALALGVAAAVAGGCSKPSCEETLTCPRSEGGTAGAAGGVNGGAGATTTGGSGGTASVAGAGGSATGGTAGGGTPSGRGGAMSDASGGDGGGGMEPGVTGGAGDTASEQGNAGAADIEGHVCDGVTCQHGGMCEAAAATFECKCAPGYEGKYCEHDINDCLQAPCLHGGACTDGVNEYLCSCEGTGYFGDRCQIAHFEWIGRAGANPHAISADGKVVVGALDDVPARWTAATGFVKLRAPSEPIDKGWASGVNADGSVIGGYASLPSGPGAFQWTAETETVSLHLTEYSEVTAVSADGNAMAGNTYPDGAYHAFRWIQAAGTEDLGDMNGAVSGMSADGTTIVGSGVHDGGWRPFRWRRSGGFFWLPGVRGFAYAISGDGNVIVGGDDQTYGSFVYTDDDGYVQLDTGDLSNAKAFTVSNDGSIIAGDSIQGAWVWDRSNGVRLLADLLRARGADPGPLDGHISSVSADGRVFTGVAANEEGAWIARL